MHGLVQQDSDFFHPLLRLHLDGKPTTLLFKKLMSDGWVAARWLAGAVSGGLCGSAIRGTAT